MTPSTLNFDVADETSLQERWDKMVQELQREYGWSPRKCRKYLESVSRKQLKKVLKRKN